MYVVFESKENLGGEVRFDFIRHHSCSLSACSLLPFFFLPFFFTRLTYCDEFSSESLSRGYRKAEDEAGPVASYPLAFNFDSSYSDDCGCCCWSGWYCGAGCLAASASTIFICISVMVFMIWARVSCCLSRVSCYLSTFLSRMLTLLIS